MNCGNNNDTFWVIFSILGQSLFFGRFFVQWLASERAGRSILPNAFWYLSIIGSLALLVYLIHRAEYVLAIGQGAGLLVYCRNLAIIAKARSPRRNEIDPAISQA